MTAVAGFDYFIRTSDSATSVDRLVLWVLFVSQGSVADFRGDLQTDFGKVSVCQGIGSFDVREAERSGANENH
ncbi:MAG: hypothetical protein R3C53_27945 [Pirellulaceae bacterium]